MAVTGGKVPAVGWELRCTKGTSNKFYRVIAALADGKFVTFFQYGAIRSTGAVTPRTPPDADAAAAEAGKITCEKLGRGYQLCATATAFQLPSVTVAQLTTSGDPAARKRALETLTTLMDDAVDRTGTECSPDPYPDVDALVRHIRALPSSSVPASSTPRRPVSGSATRPRRPRRHLTPVGPTERPNGETYKPRVVGGHEDLALMRAAQKHGDAVLLYGCPGTGKTALLDAAFPAAETLVGTADTTEADLVGTWIQDPDPTAKGFVWAPGPLQRSLEADVPLFIDEIALIDPRVLSVLYPLLDGRGELHITTNPSLPPLKRGSGWILVGAYNPDVPGVQMSEALRDRFALNIAVGSDWDLARELGVPDDLVCIAENLDERRRNGEISWSPQLRTLLAFVTNADRYGQPFALANLIGAAPAEDRDIITDALRARFSVTGALHLGARHRP